MKSNVSNLSEWQNFSKLCGLYHILSTLIINSGYMMYEQINMKKNDLRNALLKLIEFPRVTYFTGLL